MLKHVGVDFDKLRIPLFAEGYKEKLFSCSLAGKVPVYRDGDLLVWDDIRWRSANTCMKPIRRCRLCSVKLALAPIRSAPRCISGFAPSDELDADIERTQGHLARVAHAVCRYGAVAVQPIQYSITDAMFAPAAFRFLTYGVGEPGVVDEYMQTAARDPLVREWVQDSKLEQEVIAGSEAVSSHNCKHMGQMARHITGLPGRDQMCGGNRLKQ